MLAYLKHDSWNNRNLMSFKNGTLDIKQNKFVIGHNQKDFLTHTFGFNYDSRSKCPIWLNFLDEVFEGDTEVIELLRAAFKWIISPKDINKPFPIELFFDLYGPRGCGKGTIQEVLTAVCGGEKARGLIRTSTLGSPTARAALIGKKIALDPDSSGHVKDAGIFNSIVSNEPVLVKVLYVNETSTRLGVVVVRAYNDLPTTSGGGVEGLGRRMVTFRINNSATNPDPRLKEKLLAEVSGIFQWCWSLSTEEMFEILKRRGEIKSITDASIQNQLDNQPILKFLIESFPSGARLKAFDLYERYQQWSNENGQRYVTNAKFGAQVKKVQGLVTTKKGNDALWYKIGPASEFDLAIHLGIKNSAGLNPSQKQTQHVNPPRLKTPAGKDSQKTVEGMKGLSQNFHSKKIKDNSYTKKDSQLTLHTMNSAPIGSGYDVTEDGYEDPHWGRKKQESDDFAISDR